MAGTGIGNVAGGLAGDMRPGAMFNHMAGMDPTVDNWQARMWLAEEAMQKLKVTKPQLMALVRRGDIEYYEAGGVLFFSPVQVERLAVKRKRGKR